MRVGVGSYAYRWAVAGASNGSGYSLRMMLDDAVGMGCSVLQIADSRELDGMTASELEALQATAHGQQVKLEAGTSGATPDRLRQYLDVSRLLGSDVLRVVLHGGDADLTLDDAEQALRSVAASYEREGVTIAIENHFMTASEDLVALVERIGSPAVGICVDVANSIMSGEWPRETIPQLMPYAAGIHVKDYAVEPDADGVGGHVVGRRLGEGWLDLAWVLQQVQARDRAVDADLSLIVEQWCPRAATHAETVEQEARWRAFGVETLKSALAVL